MHTLHSCKAALPNSVLSSSWSTQDVTVGRGTVPKVKKRTNRLGEGLKQVSRAYSTKHELQRLKNYQALSGFWKQKLYSPILLLVFFFPESLSSRCSCLNVNGTYIVGRALNFYIYSVAKAKKRANRAPHVEKQSIYCILVKLQFWPHVVSNFLSPTMTEQITNITIKVDSSQPATA